MAHRLTPSERKELAPVVAASNARARRDWAAAERAAADGRRAGAGREGFRLSHRIPRASFLRAMAQEGREALQPGSSYMRDMERRIPWLGDPHDRPPPAHRPNLFFRDGRWLRADGTEVPKTDKQPWWCHA